ncbi:MAG: hypothetical protein PQJ59_18955 [Spirochaetales bacterium]|nr:hypothetical protein [Spirochaetales bacterium]
MKSIKTLFMVLALSLTVFSCTEGSNSSEGSKKATTLKINFAMGNNARTMTYQQAMPLTLPDGTVITQGDLKPTWQFISNALNLNIIDTAVQNQKASEMIDIASATGFKDSVIYGGNSVAERLMNYGVQGMFINLKDYLDEMPDLKAYLEANPNVAKAITAYDGGIYHVPYVAEINNYARIYCGREDWVVALLDGDDQIEAETHTLNVAYSGYWDRYDANVVDLQNAAASQGVLDAATARTTLIKYIEDTYNFDKPSDLYLGDTAVYDIDELIALWRVIELSPNTLSKVSTGQVVADAEISPYFTRKSKNREEVYRLLTYFGGQRVHGSDTYSNRFILDEEGNLAFSYAQESFLEKANYLQQIYSEGLIHSEFYDLSVKDDFRKSMYFSDDIDGQRQFGFMTFDWIASTTNNNDNVAGMLPPVTTIPQAGINNFVHYVENSRAIKPDGWAISSASSEKELQAAFKVFNYMFSEQGTIIQNYSIPDVLVEGETFTGPDGTDYPKFNNWVFDAAKEYKNGDISGFLRDFMGSHLPVGYQKQIGFELQYTSPNGFKAWDLYFKNGVIISTYEQDDDYLRLMPPIISLSEQNIAKLGTISVGETQTDELFMYITGFNSPIEDATDLLESYKSSGIDTFLEVYQSAYDKMMGK